MSRARPKVLAGAILVAALVVLIVHVAHFWPFLCDDALISLRYSQRLLGGHGLTWTDGQHVEGYSNLLWVLLCALVGLFRSDLVTAARIVGFAATGATLLAIVWGYRPRRPLETLPAAAGTLALAVCGPIAVWTIGGLESPLVAALLAWALVGSFQVVDDPAAPGRPWAAAVPFALLCLTRPDGALFIAAALLGIALAVGWRALPWRACMFIAGLSIAACGAQLLFRLAYYHAWVPNTALVKLNFGATRLFGGYIYLRESQRALWPLHALAGAAILISFVDRKVRRRVILILVPLFAWAAYVVSIGGDIFPAWRHVVPIIVMLALLATETLRFLVERGRWFAVVAVASSALALPLLLRVQLADQITQDAIRERWEFDGQRVGLFLRSAFGEQKPLLAVDPAGCLPFWSELPSLDMMGLNDSYIAHHPPARFGADLWTLAHDLGNGRYVLDRQPDLVVLCTPWGQKHACFPSGKQMLGDPEFHRDYALLRFDLRVGAVQAGPDIDYDPITHRPLLSAYVRTDSPLIGIQRDRTRVIIPALLFAQRNHVPARLGPDGDVVLPVNRIRRGHIELALERGHWRVLIEPPNPAAVLEIRADGQFAAAEIHSGEELDLLDDDVKLRLWAESDAEVEIKSVIFERARVIADASR